MKRSIDNENEEVWENLRDIARAWHDCSWGELPNYVKDEFGDAITLAELERVQKDFKAINDNHEAEQINQRTTA